MMNTIDFKVLQHCSGHLLCKPYPENWFDMSEKEQFDFVSTYVWEPLEFSDEEEWLIQQIDNMAHATQEFIDNNYIPWPLEKVLPP